MKTKILYFYPATHFAPSWIVCAQIARNLDPGRFGVFAALDHEAQGEPNAGENTRIEHFPLASGIARIKRGDARAVAPFAAGFARLASFVRSNGIDIIHTNDDGTSLGLALALSRVTRKKLVVHYHTVPNIYKGARHEVTRVVAKLATCNIAVSRFVAREVRNLGVPDDRVAFVVNGTNVSRFHPGVDGRRLRREYGIADDEILALQLARIWTLKRQEDFVRALSIARRTEPRLRGLIVGWEDPRYDGKFKGYKDELEHIAREEKLGDRLLFGKPRPEAPELQAAADIVVLPAIEDPCPLVVVEAMATGRAFVGARSGGIPEMIDDGKTGVLVEPRSPEALAEKLVLLARDPELRARLGGEARKRAVAFYNDERVTSQFAAIYEALARGEPPPAAARLGG